MKTVKEFVHELKMWLKDAKKLVIMGIGNEMRGDDAVGIKVIEKLRGRVPNWVVLLICGSTPENFLGTVERLKPTHILMVDAAKLNSEPGSIALIDTNLISGIAISTHYMPLHISAEYLRRTTKAKIKLLAIQPQDISLHIGLTEKLEKTTEIIAKLLCEVFNQVSSQ